MRSLLRACLDNGCRVALDSDAHSTLQMQRGLRKLYSLLEEINFPQELVVNASCENLVRELKLHGRACADEIGGLLL